MNDRFAFPLPFGASFGGSSTKFRIWAPSSSTVTLLLEDREIPMQTLDDGWRVVTVACKANGRYQFRMADGLVVPDPASRAQLHDVHGPSLVVDPKAYRWNTPGWMGRPWNEAVIYELHPGTMGGFDGIRAQLPRLVALGITSIELMPVSDFPGAHNWGYDGVLPYAPASAYGTPAQLKAMIDAAHGLGLMVMLDVVYNHFGPDGAYLHAYAKEFFREDIHTPWGAAIDFRRQAVRDYFINNARYWIDEYRFDGLRFDAVHAYQDDDFLVSLVAEIRQGAEPGRHIHLVMEHEGNAAQFLRIGPGAPGFEEPGFDAQWTDDFHHVMHVLLTKEIEGYYEDYDQPIERLVRVLTEGFAYQGEHSRHAGKPRGEPSGHLPTTAFVMFLQNHDQTGNRALGERLTVLTPPALLDAAHTLLLLSPFIPLLFMGEEFNSRTPFLFFTDHGEELANLVRSGRREEFKHFAAFQDPARRDAIPDPNAATTFEASKPDFAQAEAGSDLCRSLLALRHTHIVPGIPGCRSVGARTLSNQAVVANWELGTGRTLSIAINFSEEPVEVSFIGGALLHESAASAWASCQNGHLPGHAAIAWLQGS